MRALKDELAAGLGHAFESYGTTMLKLKSVNVPLVFPVAIWKSPEASPALVGAPTARVLTEVTL